MSMFLTLDEVKYLTGYQSAAHQQKFLRLKNIKCFINNCNQCVVLRSEVERVLGTPPDSPGEFLPDFEAMERYAEENANARGKRKQD